MSAPNFFEFAPKELVTDGFLGWLFKFLDSSPDFENVKVQFLKDLGLITEEEAQNKISVKTIKLQETIHKGDRTDIYLELDISGKDKKILFEDKIFKEIDFGQLRRYKEHSNFDLYVVLKLGYINPYVKGKAIETGYKVIDVNLLYSALSKLIKLNPFISEYANYIHTYFVKPIKNLPIELYEKNNVGLLFDIQAQQFLLGEIYQGIKNHISKDKIDLYYNANKGGSPWTQLRFNFKNNIYGKENVYETIEFIFWRIDNHSGKPYIRLNQYANINKNDTKCVNVKMQRLNELRQIANQLLEKYNLKSDNVNNRGVKESDIIIFYFDKITSIKELVMNLIDFTIEFNNAYENYQGIRCE